MNPEQKEDGKFRHAPKQCAALEKFYKECPYPTYGQYYRLALELGLELRQVKYWFQNKRAQVRAQNGKLDTNGLRRINESVKAENLVLRETWSTSICPTCRGLNPNKEETLNTMRNLKSENQILRQEFEGLLKLIEQTIGKNQELPFSTLESSSCDPSNSMESLLNQISCDVTPPTELNQNIPSLSTSPRDQQDIEALISALDQDMPLLDQDMSALNHEVNFDLDQNYPHDQLDPDIDDFDLDFFLGEALGDPMLMDTTSTGIIDMNKEVLMVEIANNAMEELTRLLSMNEPFWFRSTVDGKFILQRETYEMMYSKNNMVKGPHARRESSKDSRKVSMNGEQLVDMFLNSDKWVDLFPTIIKNAKIVHVFESGSSKSRDGTLQLMNAELHVLSPLVPTRQFFFLRYCKQVEVDLWVIADVSLDSSLYETILPNAWRFPSGCMIHDMKDGLSNVSWVEHVEVDEKMESDCLFKELVYNNDTYGAQRWVSTLERMCERFTNASLDIVPRGEVGVISSVVGRRNLMKLGHRMVKMFYEILDMRDNMDFQHLSTVLNNGDTNTKVSIRKGTCPSTEDNVIVSAASSFWVPISPQNAFDFLRDTKKRPQWDVLCHANPMHEMHCIKNGTNPGNFTSIMRPFVCTEGDMLILQESYTHELESLLVYAPMDIATLNWVIKGEDSSQINLLPSGITISMDGFEGSLVTVAYQVLDRTIPASDNLDMNYVTSVKKLVTRTGEKIKEALACLN